MKKTLLLAILALSINAFAQTSPPPSNSTENILHGVGLAGKAISDAHAAMNLRQPFKLQTPDQGSLIQIFDSVYDWEWDTISNGWIINFKTINYVYDPNNNLISEIDQNKVGTAWVNSRKSTSTYDTKHNRTSILYQIWKDSAWVNSAQDIYTYDVNNNQTSELVQTWKNSAWSNVHEFTYIYDSKNNRINELFQIWNDSVWVNSFQYEYTYDANNNETNELDQNWNSNAWVNSIQYEYTYDADNNQTTELDQQWIGNAWVNTEEYTYTYNVNNKRVSGLVQLWIDSAWAESAQVTYTYDSSDNLISILSMSWNGSSWINLYQALFSYDVNNLQKSSSYRDWTITGTELMDGDSSYYYFHTVSGINELKLQNAGITVYPNPTSGRFTINSKSNISSVEIYNLLGARISSGVNFDGQKSAEINLSTHSKGTYILNVHCGTKIYNCKIVVQ